MVTIQILHVADCPHVDQAEANIRAAAAPRQVTIQRREVTSEQEATRLGFRGSPTILVDGTDPFPTDAAPNALACRFYATPNGTAGTPDVDQLREVLA